MLRIESVYKNFGENEVLKDLSLTVEDGSIFGLVGVNGAGKSTLLRLISGVYEAEMGKITLDGSDTYSDEAIRSKIAFVSDETFFPHGSTMKSLKTFYQSMYDFDEEAYQKYLKMFELKEDQAIAKFSKGMKRRVSLILALSLNPRLILLDEAYDGLEPLARLRFKKILAELIDEKGISVIISSHSLKELEDICDSYGILEDGRIISYGDLLESRSLINKYQLAFTEEKTAEDFKDFDVMHFEQEGQVYKLVIKGDSEEISGKLREMDPLILNILPADFEELFIYELESRGDRHE